MAFGFRMALDFERNGDMLHGNFWNPKGTVRHSRRHLTCKHTMQNWAGLYGCVKPPMQKGNPTRMPGEGPQPLRPNKLSADIITRRRLITPPYLPTITQADHVMEYLTPYQRPPITYFHCQDAFGTQAFHGQSHPPKYFSWVCSHVA